MPCPTPLHHASCTTPPHLRAAARWLAATRRLPRTTLHAAVPRAPAAPFGLEPGLALARANRRCVCVWLLPVRGWQASDAENKAAKKRGEAEDAVRDAAEKQRRAEVASAAVEALRGSTPGG